MAASSSLLSSFLLFFLCLALAYGHSSDDRQPMMNNFSHDHHRRQQQQQQQQRFPRGRYTLLPDAGQWNNHLRPRTYTYALSPDHSYDGLGRKEILSALRSALRRWEAVIPLQFYEVASTHYSKADIKVGFYRIDRPGGALAYADPMSLGHGTYIYVDAEEHWTTDLAKDGDKDAVDLESVLVHEIGHVLGLDHTTTQSAVMYPFLNSRERKVKLHEEDIDRVQELFT